MVITAHSMNFTDQFIMPDTFFSVGEINSYIQYLFSQNLSHPANELFFIISGFGFIKAIENKTFFRFLKTILYFLFIYILTNTVAMFFHHYFSVDSPCRFQSGMTCIKTSVASYLTYFPSLEPNIPTWYIRHLLLFWLIGWIAVKKGLIKKIQGYAETLLLVLFLTSYKFGNFNLQYLFPFWLGLKMSMKPTDMHSYFSKKITAVAAAVWLLIALLRTWMAFQSSSTVALMTLEKILVLAAMLFFISLSYSTDIGKIKTSQWVKSCSKWMFFTHYLLIIFLFRTDTHYFEKSGAVGFTQFVLTISGISTAYILTFYLAEKIKKMTLRASA